MSPKTPSEIVPSPINQPERILVMDDEEYVQEVEILLLQRLGYTAVAATNCEEAVSAFRTAISKGTPFDIVILDLTIPGGMGGIETLALLKELDPSVCAIIASGYADDPVMQNPEQFGFIASLSKPYNKEDLALILRSIKAKPHPGANPEI